jgi:hypothetical protein
MKKERKRARTKKGQYVGDDPKTKEIDEAWEPVEEVKPKYETVGSNVTQRMSSYFDWLRKKFSGNSSK